MIRRAALPLSNIGKVIAKDGIRLICLFFAIFYQTVGRSITLLVVIPKLLAHILVLVLIVSVDFASVSRTVLFVEDIASRRTTGTRLIAKALQETSMSKYSTLFQGRQANVVAKFSRYHHGTFTAKVSEQATCGDLHFAI